MKVLPRSKGASAETPATQSLSSLKAIISIGLTIAVLISALGLLIPASTVDDTPAPTRAQPRPPGQPMALAPDNNARGITANPVILQWTAVEVYRGELSRADHTTITNYRLHVTTSGVPNSNGGSANVFAGDVGTTTSKSIQVEPGTQYYWAVRADDNDGSTWSATFTFSTNSPPDVEIRSPSSNKIFREGEEIQFHATADDPDSGDDLRAFEWESNIDGILGDTTAFTLTDGLSPGVHTVTFKAQDSNGIWGETDLDISVEANTAPADVRNFGPTETHDQKPTLTWAPSTDEDEDEVIYHISIGSTPSGTDIVDSDTVATTSYRIVQGLEYGSEYFVSLTAEDEYGAQSKTKSFSFEVVNTPPERPSVVISPIEPYSSNYLVCSITKDAEDPDGDEVTYEYKWEVQLPGGGWIEKTDLQGQTTVPQRYTSVGEYWRCTVTPHDGIEAGTVASQEVLIKNTPPEIEIEEPTDGDTFYTGEQIRFDASDTRDDDDDDLDFIWDFDGEEVEGKKVDYAFERAGEMTVVLTVDDQHDEITREFMLTILDSKPQVRLTKDFPASLEPGKSVTLTVMIQNTGERAIEGMSVTFVDVKGGSPIGSDTIDIDAGASAQVSVDWIVKEDHDLISVVYGDVSRPESLETENFQLSISSVETAESGFFSSSDGGTSAGVILLIVVIVVLFVIMLFVLVVRNRRYAAYADDWDDEEAPEDEFGTQPLGYGPVLGSQQQGPGLPGYGGFGGAPGPGMPGMGPMGSPYGLPPQKVGAPMALPPGAAPGAGPYAQARLALPPGGGMAPYGQHGMGMGMGMGQGPGGMQGYGQQQDPLLALPEGRDTAPQQQPPQQQPPQQQAYGQPFQSQTQPAPSYDADFSLDEPHYGPSYGSEGGGGYDTAQEQHAPTITDERLLLPEGRPDRDYDAGHHPEEPGSPPAGAPTGAPEPAAPGDAAGGAAPTCPHCGAEVEDGWLVCVECKSMLK